MEQFSTEDHTHRRYNPLMDEWVMVSPHRSKRPWQGQVEDINEDVRPQHDPACYLCAGNTRANGKVNPRYENTWSFTNDFSALLPDIPSGDYNNGLLTAKSERGICRVVIFSPRHDLTIPEMKVEEIRKVVDLWVQEYEELGAKNFINYVQIFENKGAIMGCSNPHPHGQVWAQETVPDLPSRKAKNQLAYWEKSGSTLLSDYLATELKEKERILFENDHFITLVPYWATWPFETMILPRKPISRITELNDAGKNDLADAYRQLTIRYDNLFKISFPYSAGIHQAPTDGKEHPEWHLHMSFYPPLLRSATVKKFMVGYEMLANAQRDITAEMSAARLKALPDQHYKSQAG